VSEKILPALSGDADEAGREEPPIQQVEGYLARLERLHKERDAALGSVGFYIRLQPASFHKEVAEYSPALADAIKAYVEADAVYVRCLMKEE
jgi:hypothetical protein